MENSGVFFKQNYEIKFKLKNLKRTIKREDYNGNEKLLAIFDFFDIDETKDGIISYHNTRGMNEFQSIFGMDENEDGVIDGVEVERFILKNFSDSKITSEDIFAFLNTLVERKSVEPKSQSQSGKISADSQVKENVIQSLRDDTDETLSILASQNNGSVTKVYDSIKEMFNSDTSSAKVMEAAVNQAQGAKYMEQAQQGNLTKGEYIKANKERLKEMMKTRLCKKDKNGVDYIEKHRQELKMSYSMFEKLMLATIDRMTDDMDINDVKEKMRQLPLSTDAGDNYLMDNIKKNAVVLYGKSQQAGCSSLDMSLKYIFDNTKIAEESPDDNKLLTFEEVFYYEQGVSYSKEACEEYLNNKNELTMKLSAYNKSQQFETEKENILKEKDAVKAFQQLLELFKNFYSTIDNDKNELAYKQLCLIIKEKNLPINVTQDESGKIFMTMNTGSEDLLLSYVNDILSAESQIQQYRLKNIFGGDVQEKLSELQNKVETSHEKAYGNDFSSALGKMMMEDNQTFIQRYSGGTSMLGMGLIAVGGVLCFTPAAPLGAGMVTVGQGLAVTGLVAESALGFTEALTREYGAEDDEYRELAKNFIFNASGFVIGCGAGRVGMKAFNRLIDKKLANIFKMEITKGNRAEALKQVFTNPDYLRNFLKAGGVKISTDFLISYAGDLAMMGALDTNDDWMSLLKANLMGVMVGLGSEVKGTAGLGKKGDVYRILIKKEEAGTLTKSEAETLSKLKQDPDIVAYLKPEPQKTNSPEFNTKIEMLSPKDEASINSYVDKIMNDKDFIIKNSFDRMEMEQKGYKNSSCGFDGSHYNCAEIDGYSFMLRLDDFDNPRLLIIYTPDEKAAYFKIDKNGNKVRISQMEYEKLESKAKNKSFTEDIQKFQNSIIKECSPAELLENLRKNNINFIIKEDGTIQYEDSSLSIRYKVKLGTDGSVFGYNKRVGNDLKYYIYDAEGNSLEVSKEVFEKTYSSKHCKKSHGSYYPKGYNKLKLYQYIFESDADARLIDSIMKNDSDNVIPRFNDLSFNIVKNLLRTEEDYKIFEYLMSKKTTVLRDYEYNSSDIIHILESPTAKQFVLDQINSGQSFKRAEINEKCHEYVLTDVHKTKMHDSRKIPDKIDDITMNDPSGKPLSDKEINIVFKQNAELKTSTPAGEVININGKLYCNDGDNLVKLDISKEQFEKLFPSSERFKIKQGTIGDCYHITAMSALLDTPKGRARLFSLFHQDGNDIIIRFPDESQDLRFIDGNPNRLAPISYTTKDGKPRIGFGTDHVSACLGIRLLEQAYSIHRYDGYKDPKASEEVVNDIFFMNEKMHRLDGGHADDAISDMIGSENRRTTYISNNYNRIRAIIENIKKPNVVISFSTETKFSDGSKYDLYNQHAYRIAEYDETTGMVGIVNPWNCDRITHIPIYELLNYMNAFRIIEIL